MKYEVGDKVRIKSIDWYIENKDEGGYINCGSRAFFTKMSDWCGEILTINQVVEEFEYYCVSECIFSWTDEMIECKVEEESKNTDDINRESYVKAEANKYFQEYMNSLCKEHDEMIEGLMKDGTIVDYVKESNDRYRIVIDPRFDIEVDEGGYYAVRRKKEYPKTYEECCEIIHSDPKFYVDTHLYSGTLEALYKLIICRDAYWKIAGDEMGLGKPWEPDYTEESWEQGSPIKYVIYYTGTNITKERKCTPSYVLSFPTAEMRDAFYENFKEEIEICKELL